VVRRHLVGRRWARVVVEFRCDGGRPAAPHGGHKQGERAPRRRHGGRRHAAGTAAAVRLGLTGYPQPAASLLRCPPCHLTFKRRGWTLLEWTSTPAHSPP
jgi:hypothetical protein